jgi:predicted nucleotidyltransferase
VPNERNRQLRAVAQRVADALPFDVVEEVVLTGSVSRGVADEVSDIEMLVVTREAMELVIHVTILELIEATMLASRCTVP